MAVQTRPSVAESYKSLPRNSLLKVGVGACRVFSFFFFFGPPELSCCCAFGVFFVFRGLIVGDGSPRLGTFF